METKNATPNPSTSETLQLIEQDPNSLFSLTATLLMMLTEHIDHLPDYRYGNLNPDHSIEVQDFNSIIEHLGGALSTGESFLISCNPDDYLLEVILPQDMPDACNGLTIEDLENDPEGLDCICISCDNYPGNVYVNLG